MRELTRNSNSSKKFTRPSAGARKYRLIPRDPSKLSLDEFPVTEVRKLPYAGECLRFAADAALTFALWQAPVLQTVGSDPFL